MERDFSMDLTDAAYQNEGETGFPCQPYSNRARQELRDATDLASFAKYWNTREVLRKKRDLWVLKLQEQTMKMVMQNQQQSLNIMMKFNAQANALSRIGAAGVAEAAMSDPGIYFEFFCAPLASLRTSN
jgi:ABC-type dipeptide/oligopeptide/nickel transport system ATPase component